MQAHRTSRRSLRLPQTASSEAKLIHTNMWFAIMVTLAVLGATLQAGASPSVVLLISINAVVMTAICGTTIWALRLAQRLK